MGYFLLAIGVISLVAGLMMLFKKKTVISIVDKGNTLVQTISNEQVKQDSFDLNKAKGDAFEKFVVQNFDQQYFTIQEWRILLPIYTLLVSWQRLSTSNEQRQVLCAFSFQNSQIKFHLS